MIKGNLYYFKHENNATRVSKNISARVAEANSDYCILKIIPDRGRSFTLYATDTFFWRIRATAMFIGDGTRRIFDLPEKYKIISSPDFRKKTTYDDREGVAWVRVNGVFTSAFRILYTTNQIEFETAPASGATIRVDYLFRGDDVYPVKLVYTFKTEDGVIVSDTIVETTVEILNRTNWTSKDRYKDIEKQINNKLGEALGIPLSKINEGTLEILVNVPVKTANVFVTGELLDLMIGVIYID